MVKGTFICQHCGNKFEQVPKFEGDCRFVHCPSCSHEDDIEIMMFRIKINLPFKEGEKIVLYPTIAMNIEAEYFLETKAVYLFYKQGKIIANINRTICHEIITLKQRFPN